MHVVINLIRKYWIWILLAMFVMGSGMLVFLGFKKKSPAEKVLDDINENEASISSLDARRIADDLWNEFDGPFGANGNNVNRLLKNITLADFKLISKFFGKPRRDDLLGMEGGWLLGNSKRDLIYWLGRELSDSEKESLRKVNPEIPI